MGGDDTEGKFVRIDNKIYDLKENQTVDKTDLAKEIEFYYRKTSSMSNPELVHYTATKNNKVYSATCKEMIKGQSTSLKLVYEKNGRTERRDIPTNTKFIINGHLISDADKTDAYLDVVSGSVMLVIPPDGLSSVLWIDDYDYYMVGSVGSKVLYLEDGTVVDLDAEKTEQEVNIYSASGAAGSINDIIADSGIALSEVKAANGKIYKDVYVLKSVTGTATEISEDSITVNGVEYEKLEGLKDITFGFQYTFFIGLAGEVCLYTMAPEDTLFYGYLLTATATKDVFSPKLMLKILNSAGQKEEFKLGESILFNGTRVKNDNILSGKQGKEFYNSATGKAIRQVVAYQADENGTLLKLYTVQTGEDAVLSLDFEPQNLMCKASSLFSFGGKLTVKDTGVIFGVPQDVQGADEDDFDILPSSFFENDTVYTVSGYNVSDLCEADVLISYVKNADVANYNDGNTYTCVFDHKSSVLLEDDVIAWEITYFQQGQKYSKIIQDRSGKKSYESTIKAAEKIRRGDLFKIELTADGSQIKNMAIEFAVNQRNPGTGALNHGRRIYYGRVKAVGPNSVVIQQYAANPATGYLSDDYTLYKNAARISTCLYTGEEHPVELVPNSLADVRVGDWVVIQTRNVASRALLIIRDDSALPSGQKIQ